MKINRNDLCPCGSGKKYKKCCAPSDEPQKKYVSDAHEWMDTRVLHGSYPDLYGYLVLVDHDIPAAEIWSRLKFYSEQYLEFQGDRTRRFHEIVDEEIDRLMDADIRGGFRPCFCRKGCSNCCFQPIACTDEEARLIYGYCTHNGIAVDFEKLERQNRRLVFDAEDNYTGETTWDDQPQEDQSCVFLDEESRSCRIWEVRPFVCRSHLAEKTNEYCRSHNGVPDPRASAVLYPEISYILSSVFTIHHDSVGKMMGRMLSGLKRGEG